MNDGVLQQWLDRLAMTSGQRWVLIALTVVSATAASTISFVVEGHPTVGVIVLVVALASASAMQPDSHFALITEVLLLWQWLVSADDVATPWSIGIAWCLLVFHCCVALMAVTPITASVGRPILLAWARRGLLVAAATVAMWTLVVVLDQRDAPGRALLTAGGLLALAALLFVAAQRSVQPTDQVETQ